MFIWISWVIAFLVNLLLGWFVWSQLFWMGTENVGWYALIILALDVSLLIILMGGGWALDEYMKRSIKIHAQMRDRK